MLKPEQLYQPEKFKVHLGEGTHVGFCTVWNEPEVTIKRAPALLQQCAIIGTLYGRQGVSIIIRNLALNPQIRTLYVWGFGPLSQTKFGVTGKEVLLALWKNGVNDDGSVPETNFKLEEECDPAVVRKIIIGVELVDVTSEPLEAVVPKIESKETSTYMEPVRFTDAQPRAVERFPSEVIGWVVRGNTVIGAWERVIQRIMTYGTTKGTQYGMPQKELIGVTWVIRDEDPDAPQLPTDWPKELLEVTGATADGLIEYFPVILSPQKQEGTSYTYGNRLQRYPNGTEWIDQIADGIIKNFRSSPDTRRAVATTLVPAIDKDSKEPPCLTQIQCLQSDGALHLLVTFRSHDIFKAAIANAFALRKLQKNLCAELGFSMGQLQITSQSAHIYEADWDNAKKLMACTFTEREPDLVFKAEDADPRGNVTIRVNGDEIELTLMGTDGAQLTELKGKSARALQAKLAQLDALSQTGHALDIGMELQKAQIAKDKGIPYTQDRPLQL